MMGNYHVRCGAGENAEIVSKYYLSLYYKIFYDGKEFNVLSLSEKIRATLEISNLINKLVGLNAPTFIDNSESITHYNREFDNQIILAKVVENQKISVEKE